MRLIEKTKDVLRPIIYFVPNKIREKRRKSELKEARSTISLAQLCADLDKLPLPKNAVVLVHSSLKALGYVDGGPATVVEALVDSLVNKNEGTVILPTYSIDGTMKTTLSQGKVFDVTSTVSNLGAIPEAFRKHPNSVRSIHPTHSFSAIGKNAEWFVEDHHKCGTNFGSGSPMMKMLEVKGFLLGLGTNLGNVTFYHCLEEVDDQFPINVFSSDSPFTVKCVDGNGQEIGMSLRAHDSVVSKTRIDRPENEAIRRFFTQWFEKNASLEWHRVGEADCWLVEAQRMYEETEYLMTSGITIYSTPEDLENAGPLLRKDN